MYFTCVYVCERVCVGVRLCFIMCDCVYVYMSMCIHVYTYIIHRCVFACVCVHVCMGTCAPTKMLQISTETLNDRLCFERACYMTPPGWFGVRKGLRLIFPLGLG